MSIRPTDITKTQPLMLQVHYVRMFPKYIRIGATLSWLQGPMLSYSWNTRGHFVQLIWHHPVYLRVSSHTYRYQVYKQIKNNNAVFQVTTARSHWREPWWWRQYNMFRLIVSAHPSDGMVSKSRNKIWIFHVT